jgi:hypothetical protein
VTRLLHRVVMAVTAFGLPYGWLVMAATPAATITDWGVTTPGSEALVEGPLDLVAFVQAAEEEHVQGVAIRFLRDGWPFGERGVLSYRAGPLSAGRSNWGSRLNPTASWVLGGQAMPNGLYEVQTQAKVLTSTGQQWTEWRGHAIGHCVDPPECGERQSRGELAAGPASRLHPVRRRAFYGWHELGSRRLDGQF